MARRKKIYRDKEYERDIRQNRIKEYVTYIFVVILIVDLFVMGINQNNDDIVGWGIITMGLFFVSYVIFYMLTRLYGWKILTRFDTKGFRGRDVLGEDAYFDILEKDKFVWNLIMLLLSITGTAMIVAGILKLIGKI
ncbi:MAG: hypothetical protein IJB24_04430 [Clostridia bacterium]|nr:hypothetical protein [Clostridia bacterium]